MDGELCLMEKTKSIRRNARTKQEAKVFRWGPIVAHSAIQVD